jgi:hypothetical protein
MLQPIQLPSGKIIDISKCIAIIPSSGSTNSQMILSDTQQQIQIDSADLETLQQEIKQRQIQGKYPFNSETKASEVEQKARELRSQKIEAFNSRWQQIAAERNAKDESDAVKRIIDAERPSGQKLYSAE